MKEYDYYMKDEGEFFTLLINAGYSDAYIEAVLYGRYKDKYNMKEINQFIDKAKKEINNEIKKQKDV